MATRLRDAASILGLQPGEASLWPVSAETYHARDEVTSHGLIDEFRESPRVFGRVHVLRLSPKDTWSDAMRIGSALHAALLVPAEWKKWGTVKLKSLTAEEKKSGVPLLSPTERALVLRLRAAILSGAKTGPLFGVPGSIVETPIVWRDPETGLFCKCMPDVWIPAIGDSPRIIVNVKTAADVRPHKFRYAVEDYGYARAAAWYLDGEAALYGPGEVEHVFACVSKGTLETACYTLDPADIEAARAQNRRALNRLAECHRSGDWSARWENQITVLTLAGGAAREDDYELF